MLLLVIVFAVIGARLYHVIHLSAFYAENPLLIPQIWNGGLGIPGGVAGGALLTTSEIAKSLRPGMHASTFGGNCLAARAGVATLEMIDRDNLLEHARELGRQFGERLRDMQRRLPVVREVRVLGVMIGVELGIDGTAAVQACLERRLLINCTHGTVLRLLPAMNLTEEQLHAGCDILEEVLQGQKP